VLELVTRVLEAADRPMRACDVHAAAIKLYGSSLLRHCVKEALSAYTIGGDRRFRRVDHGTYELARPLQPQTRLDRHERKSTDRGRQSASDSLELGHEHRLDEMKGA